MGMSASQMRYCMLSGKQSDVEFQGQQINQQRTTLATQSSALNTQLLDLNVPTPPSSDDFTIKSYTFTDSSGATAKITGYQYNSGTTALSDGTQPGNWTVSYTTTATGDQGQIFGTPTVKNENGNYTVGGNALSSVSLSSLTDSDPANASKADSADYTNLSAIARDLGIIKDSAGNTITNPTPAQLANKFYKYEADNVTKYILATDVTSVQADPSTGVGAGVRTSYYVNDKASITTTHPLTNATIEFSESNRMTNITTTDANGNKIEHPLSYTTSSDDKAYADAMNEYSFKKDQYEQSMNDINAKISVIQSDDKKLELKLRDLDTQQQAISTEIDSVKKVIDKNIESSFKIFA